VWCNTSIDIADYLQRVLILSASVSEIKRMTTAMKRSLLTIRLFAIALMLLLGITFTGPAAHAAPMASAARSVSVTFRNQTK
jgi:hypothetical protein